MPSFGTTKSWPRRVLSWYDIMVVTCCNWPGITNNYNTPHLHHREAPGWSHFTSLKCCENLPNMWEHLDDYCSCICQIVCSFSHSFKTANHHTVSPICLLVEGQCTWMVTLWCLGYVSIIEETPQNIYLFKPNALSWCSMLLYKIYTQN